MKTRREFIRFALGGLACLGAAILAPASLVKASEKPAWDGFESSDNVETLPMISTATSGYIQVEPNALTEYQTYTITHNTTGGESSGWIIGNGTGV